MQQQCFRQVHVAVRPAMRLARWQVILLGMRAISTFFLSYLSRNKHVSASTATIGFATSHLFANASLPRSTRRTNLQSPIHRTEYGDRVGVHGSPNFRLLMQNLRRECTCGICERRRHGDPLKPLQALRVVGGDRNKQQRRFRAL